MLKYALLLSVILFFIFLMGALMKKISIVFQLSLVVIAASASFACVAADPARGAAAAAVAGAADGQYDAALTAQMVGLMSNPVADWGRVLALAADLEVDPFAKDSCGNTALMHAARYRRKNVVAVILDREDLTDNPGARVALVNHEAFGVTALKSANCEESQIAYGERDLPMDDSKRAIINMLLAKGARLSDLLDKGGTPQYLTWNEYRDFATKHFSGRRTKGARG